MESDIGVSVVLCTNWWKRSNVRTLEDNEVIKCQRKQNPRKSAAK